MIVVPQNARIASELTLKALSCLQEQVEAAEDDMRPGKQGIAIRADLVPDLQDAITQVMQMEGAE